MIQLNFPRTHSIDEIKPLFDDFRLSHPVEFSDWYGCWKHTLTHGRPEIDPTDENPVMHRVMSVVRSYLKDHTAWASSDALATGSNDFQKLTSDLVRNEMRNEAR